MSGWQLLEAREDWRGLEDGVQQVRLETSTGYTTADNINLLLDHSFSIQFGFTSIEVTAIILSPGFTGIEVIATMTCSGLLPLTGESQLSNITWHLGIIDGQSSRLCSNYKKISSQNLDALYYIYSVINLLFKKRKSSRNTMLLRYNDTLFYQVKYKIAKFSYDYENDFQKSVNIVRWSHIKSWNHSSQKSVDLRQQISEMPNIKSNVLNNGKYLFSEL